MGIAQFQKDVEKESLCEGGESDFDPFCTEPIEISFTTFYSSRSFKVLVRPTYICKGSSPVSFVELNAKTRGYSKFGKAYSKYSSRKDKNKRTR